MPQTSPGDWQSQHCFGGKCAKQKKWFPHYGNQSKRYQRSTYSHPQTARRRMPHWLILPARPVSLISRRKDQCRWWTPHSSPLPPLLIAFFPLYMSQYFGGISERRGELKKAACVCIVEMLPGDSIPCWRCRGGGWKDGAVTCQTAGMLMPWLW